MKKFFAVSLLLIAALLYFVLNHWLPAQAERQAQAERKQRIAGSYSPEVTAVAEKAAPAWSAWAWGTPAPATVSSSTSGNAWWPQPDIASGASRRRNPSRLS